MNWTELLCRIWLSGVILTLTLAAHSGFAQEQSATIAAPGLASEGQKIFLTRCFVCHGVNGNGKGPSATGLGADPRNFTDPNWQKSVTDSRIETVIKHGGQAIGESAAMPANTDLSDSQVTALLQFIRSLGHG
ncbi:MAG: cytochrome c [Chthoniobacterales bacterium]